VGERRTTFEWDTGQISFSNRLQLRFTQEIPDGAVRLPGAATAGDQKGSFRIRATSRSSTLVLQALDHVRDRVRIPGPERRGPGSAGLNTMTLNVDWTKGKRLFRTQMGQFKVPFGRQEMTSSFNQQFVDRSIVAGEYERGRDLGFSSTACRPATSSNGARGSSTGTAAATTRTTTPSISTTRG
jgi:hypothetical protein